ncbi:family 16 glycosylhydrolase [Cytophagaceae bacterium ABcell3]|nr:family 16 glycosylhydrolase [Cytophagaceae bacterium ABcell3]
MKRANTLSMGKILLSLLLVFPFLAVAQDDQDGQESSKDYKGGEVQSKQAYHYGRFEANFYASDVSGILSTLFLFENDGWRDEHIWQEIDIEVFGKAPRNTWQSNVIYQTNPAGPQITDEETHTIPDGGSVAEWHTYAIEWTPDYVEWFVNGQSFRKFTDADVLEVLGAKPMLLMLNCWSHEEAGWVGPLEEDRLPTYQFIDYVKVYEWIEGSTFSEEPIFEDNFDNGLSNWNLSEHTFEGNIADFVPKNVGNKDGSLILAFSTNDNDNVINDAVVPERLTTSTLATQEDFQVTFYPNPVNDQLVLSEECDWTVMSSIGQVIESGSSAQVNVSDLKTGIYLLKVRRGDAMITRKFVKE